MEATLTTESDATSARRAPSPSQRAAAAPALPLETWPERDYWLGRCTGFTVEVEGRPCGRVEWVRYASRLDRPDALLVRRGRLRRRRFAVRVEDVRDIDPWLERVSVGSAAVDGV